MGIGEKLVGIFYPRTCVVCGKVVTKGYICKECQGQIVVVAEPRCIKCGKPLFKKELIICKDCEKNKHYYEKGIGVFQYVGPMKKILYKFKYNNKREYGKFFAQIASYKYKKQIKKWKIDVIIPVPMYNKKEQKRGYNQAEVFGRELSKVINIPMDEKILIRKTPTVPQKELSNEMRKQNLTNAFAVDTTKLKRVQNVLVVDDIYTTGSTIDACGKILKKARAKRVYFLAIAIGR